MDGKLPAQRSGLSRQLPAGGGDFAATGVAHRARDAALAYPLHELALGPLVHVNLIPLNPTPGSEWDASPKPVEREFVKRIRERGVSCTVRDTRCLLYTSPSPRDRS